MIPFHTDADGVVLDLSTTFHAFMREVHQQQTDINEPADFGFKDAYPHIDEISPYILDFLNSYDYFSQIKAYPEALTALQALHDLGSPVTIITSCGLSEEARRARLDTIDREMGKIIDDVHILPLGKTKEEELCRLPKGLFMDDQLHVCTAAVEHTAHQVYMRHRRYNANDSHPMLGRDIQRLTCWSELPVPGLKNALTPPPQQLQPSLTPDVMTASPRKR